MKIITKLTALLLAFIMLAAMLIPAAANTAAEETATTAQDERFPLGDADLNGKLTAADARLILRVASHMYTFDNYRMSVSDYNKDGRITASDARSVLRACARLDPFAPETTTAAPTTAPTTVPTTAAPTTKAPETTTVLTDANRKFTLAQSNLFSTKYAQSAVIYDYDNDKILYGKNMHARVHPASTTKIITAALGCEYLSGDYVLTVGNEQYLLEANTSRANIYVGQRIKFKEILKCLLVPSGCDAAYTIAVHVARVASGDPNMSASRALSYFVNMMNSYAKKLGMNDSHFSNPDGYPNSNHYTSAYDMTIMTTKAYSFKLIRDVVSQPWATAYFESGGKASYTNSNETINPYSDRYYPHMVGMKTGSHSQAGQCLVTVARKNIERTGKTKTFVAVVYNCPSKTGRYLDLKSMYNTAFSYFWRQP